MTMNRRQEALLWFVAAGIMGVVAVTLMVSLMLPWAAAFGIGALMTTTMGSLALARRREP